MINSKQVSIALLLGAMAALGIATPVAGQQINWRVENPFRFFIDPADTEVHRATFAALGEEDLRQPVMAAERQLSERHPDGWAATMYRKTCWHWQRNRFECAEAPGYINPKSHRIIADIRGIEDNQGVDCTWLTAPVAGRQRGAAVTVPCDTPVQLEVPYPAGLKITVEVGGRRIADTVAKVQDLLIAGMGDSFASGEGNPDIPVRFSRERAADYGRLGKDDGLGGYPARVGDWQKIGDAKFIEENARWLDQACHRSLYSHQLRAALQLAIEEPTRAVTYVGVACSGAETTFGLFLRYKGNEWVPSPPDLSQLSAIAEAQCGAAEAPATEYPEAYHMSGAVPDLQGGLVLRRCDQTKARKIDLIFVSIGGNDVGFSRLIANAVLADQSQLRRLGGWLGQVTGLAQAQELLGRLDDRYKSLNRALHNILHLNWKENDRVILTGYPQLAMLEDGRKHCPDGQAGMEVLSDFKLSEAKAREGDVAAEGLHVKMRAAAQTHGWTFAEAHRAIFQGRGLCAGWSGGGFSSADDLRLPRLVDGKWQPSNPADWKAYVPRTRLFRTPNDAYMTGNFHVPQSLLQTVLKQQGYEWVQLLLASTYSGAFHPTAEGQAAMADSVVARARTVLEKYGAPQRRVQN